MAMEKAPVLGSAVLGSVSNTEAQSSGKVATVLDVIADAMEGGAAATGQESVRGWIDQLRRQVAAGDAAALDRLEGMIAGRVAEIDHMLSTQVNIIMHAEPFQRLEASWRGLHYLVSNCETSSMLKVRVLNVSKDDLRRDLENTVEFDMSVLFQRVYEEEYGTLGGEPYAALIGDYEFSNHPEDVALLERFASVAAAAHAPLISGASPKLFGWESFDDLVAPRNLQRIFSTAEYVKWKAFQDSEDARYVGLTLPRILLRPPYDPETVPVDRFCFREDTSERNRRNYLWGNAAYAMGTCLARAFARHSWCALIRGVDGGGLVDNLSTVAFATGEGTVAVKAPTEVSISDRREKELADLGLIPLVHRKGTDAAAFYSAQSCQKPKTYDRDDASANARLSAQLQYILCTSRFAHYLKVMMRDKGGAMMTAGECQDYLLRWLTDYCVANPQDLGPEGRARKPLRDARVDVRPKRGKPGHFEAVVHLQPHFLLDEVSVALRLVTELPHPVIGV